jgi:hypothetical protein
MMHRVKGIYPSEIFYCHLSGVATPWGSCSQAAKNKTNVSQPIRDPTIPPKQGAKLAHFD